MIEGILLVNLDPPYISFSQSGSNLSGNKSFKTTQHCSQEELQSILSRLGAILPGQAWPPRECVFRMPTVLSRKDLMRLNLFELIKNSACEPSKKRQAS